MTAGTQSDDERADAERLRRHIRILVDLGRLAGESSGRDRFLDQAVVQVARAVEIDHVKVLRYRRKTSDFIVAAGVGWKEGVVRSATMPADFRSAAGRAFQTAEPTILASLGQVPGWVTPTLLKEHGIVSLANVPIMADGAAWGILEVDSATPRDFSQDTIEFLSAVGSLIGSKLRSDSENAIESGSMTAAVIEAQHRDVLLREMQHRVKNNFQIILASISLQKHRYESSDVHHALDHIANRINAISLAHDQLALREGQVVDLAAYMRALCASIEQQADGIAIDVDVDEVEFAIDRAVPLGLILNEAATNSIKHAFGDDGGRITVTLKTGIGRGEARMTVADNGSGMGKKSSKGSGLKLIASLARQIGGTVDQSSSKKGMNTVVTFPVLT
jgi:two-component system, sensor histidine kinase PdtaS